MSELTDRLRTAAAGYHGTDMGGLLQWAALHIEAQDEALAETRAAYTEEEAERLRLERAMFDATQSVEAALATLRAPVCPPIELGRDLVAHINIMAAHGDPDYLRKNGQSIRHTDTRTTRGSKKA